MVLGSRDLTKGEAAARRLTGEVHPRQLDVTDPQSIERLRASVETDFGRLDVLVNDAAIHYDTWQRAENADLDVVREALETNLLGAWRVTLALLPLLRAGGMAGW